jgi:hypothetical protein
MEDKIMSKAYNPDGNFQVPKAIASYLSKCPRLLPGEIEVDYWGLRDLITEDLCPATNTEWFVLADVTGLCWEIQRYTRWKDAILAVHRAAALESALQRTHFASAAPNNLPMRIIISRQEAEQWRTDPEQRDVINARLAAHGYDEETLNAGALVEALIPLAAIERLVASARSQLNTMLKGVYVRREFSDRARNALDKQLKLSAAVAAPGQIAATN